MRMPLGGVISIDLKSGGSRSESSALLHAAPNVVVADIVEFGLFVLALDGVALCGDISAFQRDSIAKDTYRCE